MGFLDRLFGWLFARDPSLKWIREPGLPLEMDLESGSLCGVRLGLRRESLSKLGPPTNRNADANGVQVWASDGLIATSTHGILVSFTAGFRLQDLAGLAAYPGTILRNKTPLTLSADSSPEDLLFLLGEPWHRYADPEFAGAPMSFFYEQPGLEWEFEFHHTGRLQAVHLNAPPVLSYPEARRRLRLQRPWPPAQ